jgi:L-lactate dehydrogenase (cytochrome)
MTHLAKKYKNQIKIMVDSGLRGGPDIARAMASGAEFTFMGRSFMYGVGALGKQGGKHTISLMKREFQQVMKQVCCERVEDLPQHLITK